MIKNYDVIFNFSNSTNLKSNGSTIYIKYDVIYYISNSVSFSLKLETVKKS